MYCPKCTAYMLIDDERDDVRDYACGFCGYHTRFVRPYKVTVSGELIVTVTYNIEAESLEAAQEEAKAMLRSHYFSDHPDAVMWVEDRP